MDRGIYAASSGGLLSSKRLDVVANNLANVSTVGFKAQRLVARQQEFEDTLASSILGAPTGDFERTPGVVQVGTQTDFTPGPVSYTGDPLHVALVKKNQFFVVATPQGEMLTRAGNFSRNAEGNIVTADGMQVLGDGGPLTLPPGTVRIAGNGSVLVNNEAIGRLRVVEVADLNTLERVEGVRFRPTAGEGEPVEPSVVPESVELANVGVVESMIDLISANKAFEAYTRTARTIDELNDRAVRTARLTG